MCVQRLDDSLNSAIHITYRISLRSSSMPEPRDPLLKVLTDLANLLRLQSSDSVQWCLRRARARGRVPPGGQDGRPAEATRYDKHGWEVGPRGPSLGNDPSAGSPTERLGVHGAVYSPPRSPGGPDYILSGTAQRPTHFHLVCGRSPYPCPPRRTGGGRDVGASLRIAHGRRAPGRGRYPDRLLPSPVSLPRAPGRFPAAGWCDPALGCPRQFESVAGAPPPGSGGVADLHGGPGWFRVVPGLPLAGLQRLQ
jgi:hypothetical protein